MLSQLDLVDNPVLTVYPITKVTYQREGNVAKRNHPDYYYAMRAQILALMEDQAGKRQLDHSRFRKHFRAVAKVHGIILGDQWYLTHYRILARMVRQCLARMKSPPQQQPLT
ncbi:MAG: hypothetical protein IPJ68_01560 [Candidatus Moraniibacteriota bacterium]|nr:MAG: hypothetical protein IPJ68_01560 [Candidatus Moranbacteria bacterium]